MQMFNKYKYYSVSRLEKNFAKEMMSLLIKTRLMETKVNYESLRQKLVKAIENKESDIFNLAYFTALYEEKLISAQNSYNQLNDNKGGN